MLNLLIRHWQIMRISKKLSNEDIAFIAELRSENICWKLIAGVFGMNHNTLRNTFDRRMEAGINDHNCL